jgi:NAD(P)-dependent dehydrogenase (short-subunit alcohol dehydrogenase family)
VRLKGRYAIITGGGQGLGACIAERYVAEGASVLLCARNEQSLEEVRTRLTNRLVDGQQVLIKKTDVTDPVEVEALMATAIETFPRLDILINNAGIYGPFGSIDEVKWDDWVQAISTNLMGTVYPCRAVLPHFKAQHRGKIINLSGGGATNPLPGISAYASSKAAVVRFSETLAEEVRDFGIEVNAVSPGPLATRLLDQVIAAGPNKVGSLFYQKMVKIRDEGGTPLEVGASLCAYLGSTQSDGITGKLISALWDPWEKLSDHLDDLQRTDIYTLRRIVPKDRGKEWGNRR